MYTNNTKGYSLVEVLVAITILLLALTGPLTIASKGLQSAYFAREQTLAVFMAQEGIEIITAMRNRGQLEFFAADVLGALNGVTSPWEWVDGIPSSCTGTGGCGYDFDSLGVDRSAPLPNSAVDCSSGNACVLYLENSGRARYSHDSTGAVTPYTRKIFIDASAATHVIIRSVVSWESNLFGGGSQVELETVLFDIYDF